MKATEKDIIRQRVRDSYANVAEADNKGEGYGVESGCCGVSADPLSLDSVRLGYSEQQVNEVPEGADMGLGCGNPGAIASIQSGETVLDLGSGGGFDCFLAAAQTGPRGKVIGVDMTPQMLSKARENAEAGGYRHVEFRLGEIENLPIADGTIDVIISNCVINLSPDKQQVFHDAFRVLKGKGRLAISDVVASVPLSDEIREDLALYSGCISGASSIDDLQAMLKAAGFENISIEPKDKSKDFIKDWAPGRGVEDYVQSAMIVALKPDSRECC